MSNDELVTRYNNIKRKQQDFENQKIQVETSINIKKTELEAVKTRLQELGVTDFDNLDAFIQAKREQFDKTLQELEARLNGSV
jgi:hypothetical protein|nr:MAG TPA: hypothetical protein [Caudoviricetes sp.]